MNNTKYYFRVAQKAEIKKGTKYFAVKRSSSTATYPNCWDFTGGKLEQGESPKEGIKREVKEETNLDIAPLHPTFLFSEKLNNHYVVFVVWKCKLLGGKVKLSHEHTEQKWVTKKELLRLKTERFLKGYLK
jgi:8-oxo-dGTP diphosphatase